MAKSRKIAMSDEQEEVLDKKTLLDLTRFLLILKKCVDLQLPENIINDGLDLYRLNISKIQEIGDMLFDEIVANSSRLNPFYTKYRLAKKTFDVESLNNRIPLIEGCFKYLHLNQVSLIEFAENESVLVLNLKDIIQGILENNLNESLKLLLNIPSFLFLKSGARSPQNWIEALIKANITGASKTQKVDAILAINQSYVNLAKDIRTLDTQIRSFTPNSREFIEKQEQRQELLTKLINEVQDKEGNDAKNILSNLTSIIHSSETHQTVVGARLKLTPEQENAMMVDGKSIIAAGAGSGKTRVLAGRVAWLIQEKGVPASSIMATSFTANSATELKERIEKPEFAGDGAIQGKGFGTSHSIAFSILQQFSPVSNVDFNLDSKLMILALKQVQMSPTSGVPLGKMSNKPIFNQYTQNDIDNYIKMVTTFMDYANYFLSQSSTPPDAKEDLKKDIVVLNQIIQNKLLPYDLSKDQKDHLNNMIASPRGKQVFNRLIGEYKLTHLERLQKIGSEEENQPYRDLQRESDKRQKGKSPKDSPYNTEPANMWFNLGLNQEGIEAQASLLKNAGLFDKADNLQDDFEEFLKKAHGESKFFQKQVSKCYNNVMSVKQLKDSLKPNFLNNALVAVYGAYLWLKENDLTFANTISGDDMLIKAIGLMLEKPSVLSALQTQYKHIMVDEAQDLNKSQHIFFGLIAGTINPGNLLPYTDGRPMRAKSFVLIGDDKQAIYEFRGATPQTFIEKSDLLQGDFKTAIIPTNFRSGNSIVDSANKLIAYNDQIPMTCVSVPSKGLGTIYTEKTPDPSFTAPAIHLMAEIKTHIGLGGKIEDYGVATRSKKQAFPFLLEALKEKIPFRSQINPLSKENFQAIFRWLEFISLPDSDVSKLNSLILELYKGGTVFYLGEKNFTEPLKEYLQANRNANLLTNMPLHLFPQTSTSFVKSSVEKYLNVLVSARQIQGSATDCLVKLLKLKDLKKHTFAEVFFPIQEDDGKEKDDEEEDKSKDYEIMLSLLDFTDNPAVVTLADVIVEIKKFTKTVEEGRKENKGMLIDTMHQWKGLECKYLTTIFADNFPRMKGDDMTDEEYEAELASERRLAYVALTRGQDQVRVISNTQVKVWDSTVKDWKMKNVTPSRFIEEACIPQKFKVEKQSSLEIHVEDILHFMIKK